MSLVYYELPQHGNYPNRIFGSPNSPTHHQLLVNSNKAVNYFPNRPPITLKNRHQITKNMFYLENDISTFRGEVLVALRGGYFPFPTHKINEFFAEYLSIRTPSPMIKVNIDDIPHNLKYSFIHSLVFLE